MFFTRVKVSAQSSCSKVPVSSRVKSADFLVTLVRDLARDRHAASVQPVLEDHLAQVTTKAPLSARTSQLTLIEAPF